MIEILVGMIASGKSTYARERARDGAIIISHDDLTAMFHGEPIYRQKHRNFYRSAEESLVANCLSYDLDIVVDRTHLTLESRARWIRVRDSQPAPSAVPIRAVVFPIGYPLTHAFRRFNDDPRGRSFEDWYGVAKHHAAQWEAEPISHDEGFDEIISVDTARKILENNFQPS